MGMKGFLSIIVGFVFKPAFDSAEKGAKQGNPFEQFNLGLMYYKGRGTAQDYTKAVIGGEGPPSKTSPKP